MGDQRTYEYLVALRAVETKDFMTAYLDSFPFVLLTILDVTGYGARGARIQGLAGLAPNISI